MNNSIAVNLGTKNLIVIIIQIFLDYYMKIVTQIFIKISFKPDFGSGLVNLTDKKDPNGSKTWRRRSIAIKGCSKLIMNHQILYYYIK